MTRGFVLEVVTKGEFWEESVGIWFDYLVVVYQLWWTKENKNGRYEKEQLIP
jgi:hypothetical protein